MSNLKLTVIAAFLLVPQATVCGQDGPRQNSGADAQLLAARTSGATAAADQANAALNDPNYAIGPDDELNVSVWKEPELSRTVSVRPDGKISLPLLNDVQAAGLTPMQLSSAISEKLKKFVSDPQVTTIIVKINSQRVFILGEVPRAGAYALLPNMTVLQALSSAGGFTQFANLKKIHVLRMENGKQLSLPFNYKDVVNGRRSEQNISLKPGDTIVVP
jgi:polysaccharide export outer membrane protein